MGVRYPTPQEAALREAMEVARDLNRALPKLSDDQRLAVSRAVMQGYCESCGGSHLPCYCTNDE